MSGRKGFLQAQGRIDPDDGEEKPTTDEEKLAAALSELAEVKADLTRILAHLDPPKTNRALHPNPDTD